ncbi:hypothetical protein FKM82_003373 [Ascaphus truei]
MIPTRPATAERPNFPTRQQRQKEHSACVCVHLCVCMCVCACVCTGSKLLTFPLHFQHRHHVCPCTEMLEGERLVEKQPIQFRPAFNSLPIFTSKRLLIMMCYDSATATQKQS